MMIYLGGNEKHNNNSNMINCGMSTVAKFISAVWSVWTSYRSGVSLCRLTEHRWVACQSGWDLSESEHSHSPLCNTDTTLHTCTHMIKGKQTHTHAVSHRSTENTLAIFPMARILFRITSLRAEAVAPTKVHKNTTSQRGYCKAKTHLHQVTQDPTPHHLFLQPWHRIKYLNPFNLFNIFTSILMSNKTNSCII